MTKYAANAMLATKISVMNEYSRLCEKLGADIEAVKKGIGSDHRIGPHFINAGLGYGGSCFPKDVSALIQIGKENKEEFEILKAVESTNKLQRERFIDKIESRIKNDANKTIAMWGVAFKPGTDDIREAPALNIIEHFLNKNYKIQIYDPVAAKNAKIYFNKNTSLTFIDDQYETLKHASCLIIPTEWSSFKEPDFQLMKKNMHNPLIFDGRNIYNPKYIADEGFEYYCIGRKS
jgi:UDPglucose 6-dehydrogenase